MLNRTFIAEALLSYKANSSSVLFWIRNFSLDKYKASRVQGYERFQGQLFFVVMENRRVKERRWEPMVSRVGVFKPWKNYNILHLRERMRSSQMFRENLKNILGFSGCSSLICVGVGKEAFLHFLVWVACRSKKFVKK